MHTLNDTGCLHAYRKVLFAYKHAQWRWLSTRTQSGAGGGSAIVSVQDTAGASAARGVTQPCCAAVLLRGAAPGGAVC